MLSLKRKFILGSAGLVGILALSASVGVTVAWRASRAVEKMLRANYDTLMAFQGMVEDTARLDAASQDWIAGRESDDWTPALEDFDKNLRFQQGNITEPGEQELTDRLAHQWADFKAQLEAFHLSAEGRRRGIYERLLQPRETVLLKFCHDIVGLNLKAVPVLSDRARNLVREAGEWNLILLGLAMALVSVGVVLLGRWVINPIRAVTDSARQIAAGNLDLAVTAASQDEVGELATSFNQMAGRLREFRRSDRAQLVQFRRSTQRALDALTDGVAFLDAAGKVELSNPVAQRLFDLHPGLAPGRDCPSELVKLLARCQRSGAGFDFKDYRNALQIFDEGQERFFMPRVETVSEEKRGMAEAGVAGLALVLVDVTGLRRLDEMKSSMVATVSHEIKTPLTGLRMALHLLLAEKTGGLNPKQEELALAARQDAERLHAMVIELLDIGRLESGRGILSLRPHLATELVGEAMAQQQADYQAKRVQLEQSLPAGSLKVIADPARLRHVFSNFLENALRHTQPGGKVTVRAGLEGAFVRFSVEDDGAGILPEHLPYLFDKFFRAPGQSADGAGLGLAISKEIVLAHGGSVSAHNLPGHGSVFSFVLPLADASRMP
jgi:NtrC-family two-component system sensor histidine kinase KinB